METLTNALHKSLEELPRQLLTVLLQSKLRAKRIRLTRKELALLIDEIMSGKSDDLSVGSERKGRKKSHITLEFTEADSKWLEDKFQEFMDDLPETVSELSETMHKKMLRTLKRSWRIEFQRQIQERDGFRRRLHKRWGRGTDRLHMLTTIAREFGADVNESVRTAAGGSPPRAFEVLVRLHARSCQVADEIVCLLENGFADGAMARWRTLHEISAVCNFIIAHGDEVAERYEAHQIVESRKAALQFQQHHKSLKQRPLPKKFLDKLEAEYQACLTTYGQDFKNPQGWAAKHLEKANPSIADIQQASGIDHLGPYYRLASHNVHANPKGIFFKLGLMEESAILLAGPSNAGMADPGHATCISLLQTSACLLHFSESLDSNVVVRIMGTLSDEIGAALLAAHRRLDADEKRIRNAERMVKPARKRKKGGTS